MSSSRTRSTTVLVVRSGGKVVMAGDGQVTMREAVELAKDWRTARVLRRLEALLLVADREHILMLSGTGDIIEPDTDVAAIGSGGNFALAAARALMAETKLSAREIAERSLGIAAEICVYTNTNFVFEEL